METAMETWKGRGDKAGALKAIAAFEQLAGCKEGATAPSVRCTEVATGADQIDLLAMVTRANYYYADAYLRGDEEGYLDYMDRAVWWGERAVIAASPEFAEKMRNKAKFEEAIVTIGAPAVPGAYWYASALGKWARVKGFAVLVGNKDKIKATMTRLLELDPNFYHGGPHRYFGTFYAVAPDFAGGDLNKSREHYEKSLEIAPYFIGTKVLMAENYATKADDEAMFDKLLEEVLAADLSTVPEEILPEMQSEQVKARELQKKKVDDELF
jgi:tetratricopeptide (TPR) repeat protein